MVLYCQFGHISYYVFLELGDALLVVIHIGDEGVHDPYQVTNFILLIFVGQMVYPFLDVGVEYFLIELSFGEGDGNIHDVF